MTAMPHDEVAMLKIRLALQEQLLEANGARERALQKKIGELTATTKELAELQTEQKQRNTKLRKENTALRDAVEEHNRNAKQRESTRASERGDLKEHAQKLADVIADREQRLNRLKQENEDGTQALVRWKVAAGTELVLIAAAIIWIICLLLQ